MNIKHDYVINQNVVLYHIGYEPDPQKFDIGLHQLGEV